MSGPEHDDLIQGEIDGVNSTADSARLGGLLASCPDLDIRFRSLARVTETLGGAERLEPPPELLDGVMTAVRRRKSKSPARPGWREAFRALFTPAPLAACACTLLIGVVLGGLLPSDSGLFSRKDRAALSGTALPHGRLDASGILDRRPVALEGVTGEAVTRIEGELLVVDLRIAATLPVEISLDLELTGLSPRAFSRDCSTVGNVEMGSRQVRFSHPAGECRYSLSFASDPSRAEVLRLRIGEGEGWDLSLRRQGSR